MKPILCIETGTNVCSVALASEGMLLSLRENGQGRDHAKHLGVYVDEVLKTTNINPNQLMAVAVSKGPGSYTGLRIGVSLAKGLCYGLNIPLIGIGSLESLARVAREDYDAGVLKIENIEQTMLCPMIDARRMEVYAQIFDSGINSVTAAGAHIITPESFSSYINGVGEFVVFGDGAAKCIETLSPKVHFAKVIPSARGLIEPACLAFEAGRFEDTAYFEPHYLKEFVATTPKRLAP
jgi:tRNA threonylcarbamoyladenosine biosynthesis protein TsaB